MVFKLRERLYGVSKRIREISQKAVKLVVVTKSVEVNIIKEVIDAGVTDIGESYIQEAMCKYDLLSKHRVSWHFIGHLQTNKVKYAVKMFDLIHSVDSLRLATEINKQAEKINKIQKILVQVKINNEVTEIRAIKNDLLAFIVDVSKLKNIFVNGLMIIPPLSSNVDNSRFYFSELAYLSKNFSTIRLPRTNMKELSMGMSEDFEMAIEEGATIVRIGKAIFGVGN